MTPPVHPSRPPHQPIPKPMPSACVAIELDPSTRLDQALTIRWSIARRALNALAPKGSSPIVHIELRIDHALKQTWKLIDPISNAAQLIERSNGPAPIRLHQSASAITIESPDLCAQIELRNPESPELIYVRTTIFAQLDIPGGRYEPIGCSLGAAGV